MFRWLNVVAALFCLACLQVLGSDEPADVYVPPEDFPVGWYARIETGEGRIVARLLPDQAPQSVAHFAGLAEGTLEWFDVVTGDPVRERYYDGSSVALSMAGRRFEVGERSGSGKQAPVIYVPPEVGGRVNFSGAYRLGMTRLGNRVSGVRFFVSASSQPQLNMTHPCFGFVVEGQDVVDRLSGVKTHPSGRPIEALRVEQVSVFTVGEPAPLEEPVPFWPKPARLELRKDKRRD